MKAWLYKRTAKRDDRGQGGRDLCSGSENPPNVKSAFPSNWLNHGERIPKAAMSKDMKESEMRDAMA